MGEGLIPAYQFLFGCSRHSYGGCLKGVVGKTIVSLRTVLFSLNVPDRRDAWQLRKNSHHASACFSLPRRRSELIGSLFFRDLAERRWLVLAESVRTCSFNSLPAVGYINSRLSCQTVSNMDLCFFASLVAIRNV